MMRFDRSKYPVAFVDINKLAHERHGAERNRCTDLLCAGARPWPSRDLANAAWESGWDAALIEKHKVGSAFADYLRIEADRARADSKRIGAPGSAIRVEYEVRADNLREIADFLEGKHGDT